MLEDGTYWAHDLSPHNATNGYYVGGVMPYLTIHLPAGAVWWKPGSGFSYNFADMRNHARNGHNLYVGAWTDSETRERFIEVSEWYQSCDDALRVAKKRGELAIWDIANGCEIRTGV